MESGVIITHESALITESGTFFFKDFPGHFIEFPRSNTNMQKIAFALALALILASHSYLSFFYAATPTCRIPTPLCTILNVGFRLTSIEFPCSCARKYKPHGPSTLSRTKVDDSFVTDFHLYARFLCRMLSHQPS